MHVVTLWRVNEPSKRVNINVDKIMHKIFELKRVHEQLGSINPASRNPDLKERRREYAKESHQITIIIEEEIGRLMNEAFAEGLKAAKLSDGKLYHCPGCHEGFDIIHELVEHAVNNETCKAALEAKLAILG